MHFSDRFKSFLKMNKNLLNNYEFDAFYDEFKYYGCAENTPTLTKILLESRINPINYFTYIPDSYASNSNYMFDHINLINNDKLEGVGQFAFHNCSNLKSILLPEGLGRIYMCAFMYCDNLREVRLPSTLTMLGDCAFHNCKNLTNIKFMGTMEEWKNKVEKIKSIKNIFYKVPARKINCIDGYCNLRI